MEFPECLDPGPRVLDCVNSEWDVTSKRSLAYIVAVCCHVALALSPSREALHSFAKLCGNPTRARDDDRRGHPRREQGAASGRAAPTLRAAQRSNQVMDPDPGSFGLLEGILRLK